MLGNVKGNVSFGNLSIYKFNNRNQADHFDLHAGSMGLTRFDPDLPKVKKPFIELKPELKDPLTELYMIKETKGQLLAADNLSRCLAQQTSSTDGYKKYLDAIYQGYLNAATFVNFSKINFK
jgi:hypothetical protein